MPDDCPSCGALECDLEAENWRLCRRCGARWRVWACCVNCGKLECACCETTPRRQIEVIVGRKTA